MIHSAPARVLPAPRPPSMIHAVQSPGGANWSGLPWKVQLVASALVRGAGISVSAAAWLRPFPSHSSKNARKLRAVAIDNALKILVLIDC